MFLQDDIQPLSYIYPGGTRSSETFLPDHVTTESWNQEEPDKDTGRTSAENADERKGKGNEGLPRTRIKESSSKAGDS